MSETLYPLSHVVIIHVVTTHLSNSDCSQCILFQNQCSSLHATEPWADALEPWAFCKHLSGKVLLDEVQLLQDVAQLVEMLAVMLLFFFNQSCAAIMDWYSYYFLKRQISQPGRCLHFTCKSTILYTKGESPIFSNFVGGVLSIYSTTRPSQSSEPFNILCM